MRARVVIGANFGDEGKGLITDYLCHTQGAGIVVRFNGGAQAGHTVVRPDGQRHVFHHMGSGAFENVPTYLSQYFIINPICYYRELHDLHVMGLRPMVYAHPECLVTTFADMMINQHKEDQRGDKRHGSVGMGVNETVNRSKLPELKITMADIWNGSKSLENKLKEICRKYAHFRMGKPIDKPDEMIAAFINGCQAIANDIHPLGIGQCEDPVFEGAQGLLLDQNNKEFYPHLTRSNTGMKNVRALCDLAGIKDIEAYYISRTYLTKHGAGKLPGEDAAMSYPDDTNLEHPYQGTLRFAPMDMAALRNRCAKDFGSEAYNLVLTHMDQLPLKEQAHLYAYGPTYESVKVTPEKSRTAA